MQLKPHQKELIKTYATTPTSLHVFYRVSYFSLTLLLLYLVLNVDIYPAGKQTGAISIIYCYLIVCIGVCLWRIGHNCLHIHSTCEDKNFVFNATISANIKGEYHRNLMENFIDFRSIKTRAYLTLDWMQFSLVLFIAADQKWFKTGCVFALLFLLAKLLESMPQLISTYYLRKLTPDMIVVKQNLEMHPYFEIKESLPTDFEWEPELSTADQKQLPKDPFKRYKRSVQLS